MRSTIQSQTAQHGASQEAGMLLETLHTTVPGRARFRVPALYRADGLADRVEARLSGLGGIRSARVNSLTASLLIHFNPTVPLDGMVAAIERELTDLSLRRASFGNDQTAKLRGRSSHPSDVLQQAFTFARPDAGQVDDRMPVAAPPAQGAPQGAEPWHALSPQDVLARLGSTAEGLSGAEAAERYARVGANSLPKTAHRSDLSLFLEQFASPPVALLGVSAAVAIATGGLLDAVAIGGVVLINALIGFLTERQSERIIASLAPAEPARAAVLRGREWRELPVDALVPGDVVTLAPGTYVAADGRLLEAERLTVDESPLTGESMPVAKSARALCPVDASLGDRCNMVYMGTVVTGGSAAAVVVGIGLNTELGRIHALAAEAKPPETPMERQLAELGAQLAWLSSIICGAVFVIGLLRGYGWLQMLKSSVSLAVAAVPEGLPVVATTTLALGINNMRQRKVLVRRLDAVETLGSVQFFCFDKTGTLTLNRMTVVALHAGMKPVRVDGGRFFQSGLTVEPLQAQEIEWLCEVVTLCNETEVDGGKEHPRLDGSATEKALVELALHAGLDVQELRQRLPRLEVQHRAEDRPYMVTMHANGGAKRLVAVKGSPEHVLGLCRRYLLDGEERRLDEEARAVILRENERMAGDALRLLGVAYGLAGAGDDPLGDLTWLGLVGMADPVRPGMDVLMRRFRDAGINTAMITGDQSATAYAIARQLNLAGGNRIQILDSISLDKLDPEVLSGLAQRMQVFSRVSPAHKLQIVQALQRAGKTVAMTGDGINDGPALKAADLGVAMGGGGTEVARSMADIVLEDDNLGTMEVAVRHGRTTYVNVRKALRFLLSTNLSEIDVMLLGIGLGLGQPLNSMQLLWINLITDIFPGLALAMERPEPDVMNRPPRDPREPVLSGRDLRRLGLESAVISTGTLASYGYALLCYGQGPQASTQAFMTLTLAQLLHALSSRSSRHSLFDRDSLPPNPYLKGALGASLAAQALTLLLPGLRKILGTTPMGLLDAAVMAAGAVLPLLVNEATKKLARPSPRDAAQAATHHGPHG